VLAGAWLLLGVSTAAADGWLPHPADAKWEYVWSDSAYNPPPGTTEKVTVKRQAGVSFTLGWATEGQPPGAGDPFTTPPDPGTITFQDTNAGLVNTDWSSLPAPPGMPILCASTTGCANSLSSTYYNVIWGNRAPVLSEPLLRGTSWNSTGGAQNDVASSSQYLGMQPVSVAAFPSPVQAAVVRTNITQAGSLGDPYGSGVRTTWWVYGVGPVKIVFDHCCSSTAPVTLAELKSTSLTPGPPPPDQDYFPLRQGQTGLYRWTNSKHLGQPEVERVTVAAVSNRTAQVAVKSVSGPIRVQGAYGFTTRIDGVTNLWGSVSAATLAVLPPLGHGRHFFTPLDLMTYGFNPLIPAYPQAGSNWHSGNVRDFQVYGVTGSTTVLGVQNVRVPAGRFTALLVRSVLTQRGSRFGSGLRMMWLAPGRGLVKLVFRHRDGSVSLVQLVR
jgi:hypothetical protein